MTLAGFAGGDDGMENYYRAQGFESDGVTPNPSYTRLLDVEALTDYMLVHYWCGELDGMAGRWGLNNYVCAFNRNNPDGFKFFNVRFRVEPRRRLCQQRHPDRRERQFR